MPLVSRPGAGKLSRFGSKLPQAVRGDHWSVLEQAKKIIAAASRLKIRMVRIEDVAYQRALGDVLDCGARLAGVPLNVDLVKPDTDMLRRANAWSPLVEDGTTSAQVRRRALRAASVRVWHLRSR